MTIDEVFCFTSSLYFRGKLSYAKRFATPAEGDRSTGIFVIAPGVGLVAPDWKLDSDRIRILQQVPVDLKQPAYQKPFHDHALALSAILGKKDCVILLGSLATDKYVGILQPIFRDRLLAPRSFLGAGDMSRGAMLLRAAASGQELDYMVIERFRSGVEL